MLKRRETYYKGIKLIDRRVFASQQIRFMTRNIVTSNRRIPYATSAG